MKLFMYEVQFTHVHVDPKGVHGGWRPNARRFVFTTDPVRAMELATAGHVAPIVHQVILRSGDGGVVLDPLALTQAAAAEGRP